MPKPMTPTEIADYRKATREALRRVRASMPATDEAELMMMIDLFAECEVELAVGLQRSMLLMPEVELGDDGKPTPENQASYQEHMAVVRNALTFTLSSMIGMVVTNIYSGHPGQWSPRTTQAALDFMSRITMNALSNGIDPIPNGTAFLVQGKPGDVQVFPITMGEPQ